MKHITSDMRMVIQGDVCFTRIDPEDVPTGVVPANAVNGQLIVAHSGTGHNHSFHDNGSVALFENPNDELVAYMQVDSEADLVHHRTYDTHETLRFNTGVYRVSRQREHTPEGWRRVED